jgi:methylmalonyl-CoA mutase C-terminal domain/subunit
MTLFPRVAELLAERGAEDVVVFGGGIIPQDDIEALRGRGLAGIFTPGTPLTEVVEWVEANVPEH